MAHGPPDMLRPRVTIDAAAHRAKLDDVVGTVRREADTADADPFDDAMVAAVYGVADALKAQADALAEMEAWMAKLA